MADDAARCLLPPMILQPLVENAVKHGIGQLPQGGVVRVHAARAGSQLKLRVENDVDPDGGPADKSGGVGLANVRQRLAAAYGIDASVHATRDGAIFRVDLILPADMGD
jgi:two-component system sensor histidine kinase AlgZ